MRPILLVLLAVLAGCARIPESYPVPEQQADLTPQEPDPVGAFVNANDANAELYILKDISKSLEGGSYRWTNARPQFRFRVKSNRNLKFVMDFGIAGTTFEKTGPVTFTYEIGGKTLAKVTYDSPGEKHFEKPVPPGMIPTDRMFEVSVVPDKTYTADDGVILNFIFVRAGFLE